MDAAAGGTVPVVYQFKAGQGDSKAAVAQIKQGMQGEKVNGVFISTSNLTFAAGKDTSTVGCCAVGNRISCLAVVPPCVGTQSCVEARNSR